MSNHLQVAAWWANERTREFTKLECGLLGALFSAVGLAFLVTLRALVG